MIPLTGRRESSQRIETQTEEGGGVTVNGYKVSDLQRENDSGSGWWGWLHNNVNVLTATQPHA